MLIRRRILRGQWMIPLMRPWPNHMDHFPNKPPMRVNIRVPLIRPVSIEKYIFRIRLWPCPIPPGNRKHVWRLPWPFSVLNNLFFHLNPLVLVNCDIHCHVAIFCCVFLHGVNLRNAPYIVNGLFRIISNYFQLFLGGIVDGFGWIQARIRICFRSRPDSAVRTNYSSRMNKYISDWTPVMELSIKRKLSSLVVDPVFLTITWSI